MTYLADRRINRLLPIAAAVVILSAFAVPALQVPQPEVAAAATVSVAPPTNLRVPTLAFDDTSITLAWEKPTDHPGVVDYRIFRDGEPFGLASENRTSAAKPLIDAFYADPANSRQVRVVISTFTATGLRPSTSYRFTVRTVHASGAESVDSPAVTQSTTAVPRVFDVASYGAVGDGVTVNTAAIQAAIDVCTPGGKVVIPAGVFVSGALWLKSDMTLQVGAGATLLGSANADDYPYDFKLYDYSTDSRFYSLINAHTYDYGSLHDIRIVGPGVIDGNGWKQNGFDAEGFPVSAPSTSATVMQNGILAKAQTVKAAALGSPAPYPTRSNLITFRGVRNAYYGNFTAHNPANHTLVNLHTANVTVNAVRVETFNVNNADGVEFGNSTGLQVINSVFDTGDDCVNFAAGLGAASENDNQSGNAWIANNYFRQGHGAIVAGSHTGAWISDIVAEDNVINRTDVALRMKTDPSNGGGARRIEFKDNAVKAVANEAFIFTSVYTDANAAIVVEPAAHKAQFRDVLVANVTVDGTGREAIRVLGVADQPHQSIYFRDVRFLNAKPTNIAYLRQSWFTNVTFDATPNPWVVSNSSGLTFEGSTVATAVTTDAAAAPTWPTGSAPTATADAGSVLVSWSTAVDNVAVADYRVYLGETLAATVPAGSLTYRVTGLSPALSYTVRVVAEDATGNQAGTPTTTFQTTGSPDTVPPVAPVGNVALSVSPASVGTTWTGLQWLPATDDHGVQRYEITANGQRIGTVRGDQLTYTATRLSPATAYVLAVTAVDATGNATGYPTTVAVTTKPRYDTAAPAWPGGPILRTTAVGRTSATLTWTAATDDTAVVGYRVYQDGLPLPGGVPFTPVTTARTTAAMTYQVTGLQPNRTYTFTVQAGDAAAKWSGSGPSITVTTAP